MMNQKTLGILAGVLVVLGILAHFTSKARYSTAEGGGYVSLLDGSLDPASIERIRAWLGSAPDKPVELERSGEGWVVASRWGWKAKEDLVERLLTDFAGLKGEKRASSEDVLADFQTDDEKGLHIVAQATGGTELFHLVVGKTALRGGAFVRRDGSNDVYLTPASLRSSFGVWGDEPKEPDPKRWIELRVHQADRTSVDRIVVRDGASEIVLEKEFELTVPPEPERADGEGEDEESEASESAPPEPVINRSQWTWKPDADGEFDKGKADGILSRLSTLYAFDVADPDSLEVYGLADPERSVEIRLDDGESVSIFFGKETEDGMKVYFRVGDEGMPAQIYKSTVDGIFLARSDLKPQA